MFAKARQVKPSSESTDVQIFRPSIFVLGGLSEISRRLRRVWSTEKGSAGFRVRCGDLVALLPLFPLGVIRTRKWL